MKKTEIIQSIINLTISDNWNREYEINFDNGCTIHEFSLSAARKRVKNNKYSEDGAKAISIISTYLDKNSRQKTDHLIEE